MKKLLLLALFGSVPVVAMQSNAVDYKETNRKGQNIIHQYSIFDLKGKEKIEFFEDLLKNAPNDAINHQDNKGFSPIWYTFSDRNLKGAQLLVQYGAHLTLYNKHDSTLFTWHNNKYAEFQKNILNELFASDLTQYRYYNEAYKVWDLFGKLGRQEEIRDLIEALDKEEHAQKKTNIFKKLCNLVQQKKQQKNALKTLFSQAAFKQKNSVFAMMKTDKLCDLTYTFK